ncbi:MAG: DUF58 domain-containing protein [Defluviitaleaceae bacterium]|nr:DUF58 domain-containing protein [Defluviitaleaceae bacterium]
MSVTKTFICLAFAGVAAVFATWVYGGAYFAVFAFWNITILGLFLLDMCITPKKANLQVRRAANDKLYFLAENELTIYVRNNSWAALDVEVRDEAVRHFDTVAHSKALLIPNGEQEQFSYTLIAQKRGCFEFKHVYIRYRGVLGLCVKYAKFLCPIEFKVYPNVKDLSKYRLMLQNHRLLPIGDRSIKNYGMGSDFESLRPYVDGDDYRRINWRATSRENKLIVNQFQIERNQPVYILLDISRPMSYSVGGYKKLDYAINAALILSDIVTQNGDKAGLMVFDSQVRAHIAPGQGAAHKTHIMDTLYTVEDNRSTADYGGAFQALCQKQKRRSLVFIFTDFEIPEEARELIFNMKMLKRKHLPVVIFMENENLNELCAASPLVASADGRDKPRPRGRADRLLRDTAREFKEEREDMFRYLSAMGIPNVESSAEEFAAAAVNRYIRACCH